MRKWLGKLKEKKREVAARRRTIKRGKNGFGIETMLKVIKGVAWQEESKLSRELGRKITEADARTLTPRFVSRAQPILFRMVVKNYLDRQGIVNTKADPKKRQRIHKLIQQWLDRREFLKRLKTNTRERAEDQPLQWLEGELARELGGNKVSTKKAKVKLKNMVEILDKTVTDLMEKMNRRKK